MGCYFVMGRAINLHETGGTASLSDLFYSLQDPESYNAPTIQEAKQRIKVAILNGRSRFVKASIVG